MVIPGTYVCFALAKLRHPCPTTPCPETTAPLREQLQAPQRDADLPWGSSTTPLLPSALDAPTPLPFEP